MVEQGEGQALVFTSAAGARPTPGAPLYSSARAGANMLVRNVAAEVAGRGVQVNAVGTNFMDFPEFLRAVVPAMVERGEGQVLVITSAAGAKPTPGAPLYSSARAGANMLVRNVAGEVARTGVQVNAVGTNFMDFPEFLRANRITDDESRAKVEGMVPMRRLGTMEEFAAFCAPYVDGTSRFTTGQFTAYAGGWA